MGLSVASLGSETSGSIINPCSRNGIVGFKPTTALVPRDGVIPLSDRQDSVGPMARTVRDAAHVLTAIADPSVVDGSMRTTKVPDYLKFTEATDLTGLRIGVPREDIARAVLLIREKNGNTGEEKDHLDHVLAIFSQALRKLAALGATVVDNVKFRSQGEWNLIDPWPPATVSLEAEFKASLARWCSMLINNPQGIRTVDDLIDFTCRTNAAQEEYPKRDVGRLLNAQKSPGVNAPVTQESLRRMLRCSGDEGILGALKDYKVDTLVFPHLANLAATAMAAGVGLPIFALPLGHYPKGTPTYMNGVADELREIDEGIPYVYLLNCSHRSAADIILYSFGIDFTAGPYTEPTLIRISSAFQKNWHVTHKAKMHVQPRTQLKDVLEEKDKKRTKL